MIKTIRQFSKAGTILILLCLLQLAMVQPVSAAGVNRYEQDLIQKQILKDFEQMIQMWQEELYFDLYDYGQIKAQAMIKKGEFAQRMVDLKWRPKVGSEKTKVEKIQLFHRTFASIHVSVHFENKLDPDKQFTKKMVYPVILEYNKDKKQSRQWKFDLIQVIRTPY